MNSAERDFPRQKLDFLGRRLLLTFHRFVQAYERRYSEDQPRISAGQPGAGQFTFGDRDRPSRGPRSPAGNSDMILAGGFEPGDASRTVQEFVAAKCEGRIYSVLPGQFLDLTISEVQGLARSGDAAARTCMKVLSRDKYRK